MKEKQATSLVFTGKKENKDIYVWLMDSTKYMNLRGNA